MTREEAIEVIKAYRDKLTNSASNQLDGDIKALDMAIQALEKENIYDDKEHYVTISKALYDKLNIDYEQALSQEPCITLDDFRRYAIEHNYEIMSVEQYKKAMSILLQEPYGTSTDAPTVTQKSGKWIKTTDRLPEDKTYVLTTIKVPNRVAHARSGWYECGFFHNDNGDTWRATDREVKAWMPLPKPYEPQESEE